MNAVNFLKMRVTNKQAGLHAIWLTLVMFVLFTLAGCYKFQKSRIDEAVKYRQIQTLIKIVSPDKIFSTTAIVSIAENTLVYLDILDFLGLSQMIIITDARQMVVIDTGNRCKMSVSGWLSKLSFASGAKLSLGTLTEWLFPETWPETARTLRIAREGSFHFDISVYPPGVKNSNGQTVLLIPEQSIQIEFIWIDQYDIDYLSIDNAFLDWTDCTEKNVLEMVFR